MHTMFILRRITKENLEINTCLGIEYVLILKERSPEQYEETVKVMGWGNDPEASKDVYGFITFNDGSDIMPLYKGSHYFIMGSDGNTVANITNK